MPDPEIPLIARRGAQRAYDHARGTDYSALVDRKIQSSSVRPPPLTEGQLAGLEQLENDYQNLRDAEFTKRYGRSRVDYWKVRDLLVNLRNQHLRAQGDAIRIAEEIHGKIDIDRQWQAEQDFSNLNRAVEAVRSSPLAAAFLLYANTHGGSLKQQVDAAELGQATAALAGALTAAGGSINKRQELREYKGSAGLTLQREPTPGPIAESEAMSSPQRIESRARQPQMLDSERKITSENRGLVSADNRGNGRSPPSSHTSQSTKLVTPGSVPTTSRPTAPPVDPEATPPYGVTVGGRPIVRLNAPQIDLGVDEVRATWPGDSRAIVSFKEIQDGIEIGYINTGQQTQQGHKMLASALQGAAKALNKPWLARPSFLQSQNVINATLKGLIESGRMDEAAKIVRRSSLMYARELGGTPGTPVLKIQGDRIISRVPITY